MFGSQESTICNSIWNRDFRYCIVMMVRMVRLQDMIYFIHHKFYNFSFTINPTKVMSDSTSWTGRSWRLIGAISRLHEHSLLRIETPPIVVLIPSGEGNFPPGLNQRHLEYGDFVVPTSQAHGHFVARALHPYLMQRFRVKKGPEHTYTIGSSLGGQASLQLVLRYPEIFGGAACMSPCFQTGTIAAVVANLVKKYDKVDDCQSLRSKRIYLDNGGDVDETRVPIFDILDQFTMNHPGFFWLGESAICWMMLSLNTHVCS